MFQPRSSLLKVMSCSQLRLPSSTPTTTGGFDLSVRLGNISLRMKMMEPPRDTPPKKPNLVGSYSTTLLRNAAGSVCELEPPAQVKPSGLALLKKFRPLVPCPPGTLR